MLKIMNKLAVFFFAAILVALAAAEEPNRDKFKRIHDECQSDPKTKVSEEFMRQGAIGEHVDEPNAKAHTLCMSKKLGLQDEHGKAVKSVIKSGLSRSITDEAKLEEAVNKCSADKDTPEDTAGAIWHCMRDAAGPRRPPPHDHH